MRYFQKLLCLLILVLAASFGVGGCVLLYSDFSVQRSRMAAANAAAHAQACTLLQTEILDLQRRGISTGDAALTARVTAQDVPAALWRGDTLVCATLEGLQNFPLGDAATVTVRTENSIYAVYASDLQGGLRLVTAYDLTGLYRDRNAALMRFLLLEAAVLAAASAVTALLARRLIGKYIAPEAKHLTERVKAIEEGEFNALIEDIMRKPIDEIKELYNNREIEK